VLVREVKKDPRYIETNPETRSELAVPLIYNDKVIGVLDLEHTYSLLEEVPAGKAVLSQGGVRERDQVEELERAGVDAVILGAWALAGDLPATLRTLRGDSR